MVLKKIIFFYFISNIIFAQVNYFPLIDGNIKNYIMLGTNGEPFAQIMEEFVKEGNLCMVKTIKTVSGVNIKTLEMYEIKNDGIYEIAGGGGLFASKFAKYKKPLPVLKFPIKIGKKWSYTENGGRKIKKEIITILKKIDVKGTTYSDVLEIKHTVYDGEYISSLYLFYANGIGLIKEEIRDNGKTQLFKYLK